MNLCRFIEAVQAYTQSRKVDIVAHSLDGMPARDTMRRYPALAHDVVALVGIAGGDHGTSICRGIDTSFRVQRAGARLAVVGMAQRFGWVVGDAWPDEVDDDLPARQVPRTSTRRTTRPRRGFAVR